MFGCDMARFPRRVSIVRPVYHRRVMRRLLVCDGSVFPAPAGDGTERIEG